MMACFPFHSVSEPAGTIAGAWTWKWNVAIINVINYTCLFPTMTCQTAYSEKGMLANCKSLTYSDEDIFHESIS